MIIRRRVVVRGRVQGVAFRDSCRRQAQSHGVAGWVTNRDDGAVEAVFEGDGPAVQAMINWAGRGPSSAQVTAIEVADEEPRSERGFVVR